eukprot:scaffold201_cov121-Isochrysis_galbana.AAC.7
MSDGSFRSSCDAGSNGALPRVGHGKDIEPIPPHDLRTACESEKASHKLSEPGESTKSLWPSGQ